MGQSSAGIELWAQRAAERVVEGIPTREGDYWQERIARLAELVGGYSTYTAEAAVVGEPPGHWPLHRRLLTLVTQMEGQFSRSDTVQADPARRQRFNRALLGCAIVGWLALAGSVLTSGRLDTALDVVATVGLLPLLVWFAAYVLG